jgi:hypothetical protein
MNNPDKLPSILTQPDRVIGWQSEIVFCVHGLESHIQPNTELFLEGRNAYKSTMDSPIEADLQPNAS